MRALFNFPIARGGEFATFVLYLALGTYEWPENKDHVSFFCYLVSVPDNTVLPLNVTSSLTLIDSQTQSVYDTDTFVYLYRELEMGTSFVRYMRRSTFESATKNQCVTFKYHAVYANNVNG